MGVLPQADKLERVTTRVRASIFATLMMEATPDLVLRCRLCFR